MLLAVRVLKATIGRLWHRRCDRMSQLPVYNIRSLELDRHLQWTFVTLLCTHGCALCTCIDVIAVHPPWTGLRDVTSFTFAAWCYAERGIARLLQVGCLSLSVTLRYRDHKGWNTVRSLQTPTSRIQSKGNTP